ncbi:MAG: sulfatase-like hydrolase/transferase, partial [Actinobacteria bacterium]|nr:sulfatase-like hydrolase/transferase [Actinomycetota bacterium]
MALAAAALITGALAARGGQAAPQATRPNVIVLMTDDQDSRSLAVMTRVQRLLGDEGVTFDSSFVSFSLCCPSRATFLTGQYAHNHGVLGNEPPQGGYTKLDNSNTLPVWLRRAGYHTGLVGKYLTGYGYLNPATEVPPGWEEWHGTVDPSTTSYFGYTLNENGSLRSYNFEPANYQTDVEGQKAVDLVRR